MSTLLHRFWRREDGVAAIEFALIAPIVLILFVGMVNVGFRLYEESRLNQATRETAEAAMFTRNLTSLQAVLDNQLASLGRSVGGEPFTGTVTLACECVDPAQPTQCAGTCAGSSLPSAISVRIEASLLYRPLFPLLGRTVTLQSRMQVQVR
jgi:Flp pilus assembly protein TadG